MGNMNFSGDSGESDDERNHHSETELQNVMFVEILDSECGVTGWRCRESDRWVDVESNRLFENVEEAIQDWQQSRRTN